MREDKTQKRFGNIILALGLAGALGGFSEMFLQGNASDRYREQALTKAFNSEEYALLERESKTHKNYALLFTATGLISIFAGIGGYEIRRSGAKK